MTAASARAMSAADSTRTTESSLLGLGVTTDAGSVGTLTGHITSTADSRILERKGKLKLWASGGKASVIT